MRSQRPVGAQPPGQSSTPETPLVGGVVLRVVSAPLLWPRSGVESGNELFFRWMAYAKQPTETPGWPTLASKILDLSRTGPEGFEGLVSGWLSQLLSQRFYVASSGRQSLGDAASHSLDVGIQAKLYRRSPPRAVEILGDLESLARNLDLQAYVLASTADLTLDRHHEIGLACADKGIDFVFLGLSRDGLSDMGALAVTFWPKVTASFLESPGMALWAATEARTDAVTARLERLRVLLAESINSKRSITLRSRERLLRGLFPSGSLAPSGTSVDATRLVDRHEIYAGLDLWWPLPEKPLLVVGEAEFGTSWAVAGWLRARLESLELPVVWLDSHRWHKIHSLEDLAENIARNLCGEFCSREGQAQRILRKLTSRWPAPACLVILDGANQLNDAPAAAHQILSEYLDDGGRSFRERCKLVITTHPPEVWLPGYLRKGCIRVEVPRFTLQELDEAVRKTSEGRLGMKDIPESLQGRAWRAQSLEELLLVLGDRTGGFA
jgi:hypothetical protein